MSVDVELVVSYCFFCFLAENIIVNKLQLYVEMYIQLKELFCKSEKLMAIKLVLYGSLKQFSCNFHKTETVNLTIKFKEVFWEDTAKCFCICQNLS